EEQGPVAGVPDHAQALVAAAAAVFAGTAGRGLDLAPKINERLGQLPDFHVAHVAFRVPDGGRMADAIPRRRSADAIGRALERVDGMDVAMLVEAAALHPVGSVGVAGVDLFQIAAPEIRAGQADRKSTR